MKRRANYLNRKSSAGFTLFEMAIVLSVMGIIAYYATPNYLQDLNEKRSNVAIQETQTILDAARVYRLKMGHWPAEPDCSSAKAFLEQQNPPYLSGVADANKFNASYSTACDAYTFSISQNVMKDWDEVMVNGLPGSVITDTVAHTIVSTIGIPGTEPALDAKLSRIATDDPEDNRMRTDIDMEQNSIRDVDELQSTLINNTGRINTLELKVTRTVVLESACSEPGLIAQSTGGIPAFCQNGTWGRAARWYTGSVTNGGNCLTTSGNGSFGFDNAKKLYVCK